MTMRMQTDLGEASQASVKVVVPQTFGFTIPDATEEVGMSALVERQFSVDITNDRNGQDSFTVELLESMVPTDWSVTTDGLGVDPPTRMKLARSSSRSSHQAPLRRATTLT